MHVVGAQTKAKRLVNQEECGVLDLGNHMNITAKHCQVAAQDCQNIWHSHSLIFVSDENIMKVLLTTSVLWLSLFSFLADSKSLYTNHTTAKKSKYAFNIWCSLRGWEKNGTWFRNTKFKYYKHFYRTASSHQDTMSPKLKRNIWHAKVICWRNFSPVHVRGFSLAICS